MNKEIKHVIWQLKDKKINISDIPEEYKNDTDIIKAERELGLT